MAGKTGRLVKPITKENKAEWLKFFDEQINDTENAKYTNTGVNRVFLTGEDDIDIAKYLLAVMRATVENL